MSCEWCGACLDGFTIRREYCNSKCRGKAYTAQRQAERAEARKAAKCAFCGGPFNDQYPGKYYCSEACKQRSCADMAKKKATCIQCSKTFRAAVHQGQKFCSHECYSEAKRVRQLKQCEVCDENFMPLLPDQRTCCSICRIKLSRKLPDIICRGCGVPFRPSNSKQACCCRSCAMYVRNRKKLTNEAGKK